MKNDTNPPVKLSSLEETILAMLMASGSEMFGLELVEKSNGLLARGSIYVTLARMAEKGLVESRTEARPKEASGIPRRLYRVTGAGKYAVKEYRRLKASVLGSLEWSPS